jgi:hypothetical protein
MEVLRTLRKAFNCQFNQSLLVRRKLTLPLDITRRVDAGNDGLSSGDMYGEIKFEQMLEWISGQLLMFTRCIVEKEKK